MISAPRAEIATMRAGVVTGPGRSEMRGTAIPDPGPGEVRLKLEGCGVCGSNLPLWEGRPWFDYPLPAGAPGHEGWGTVEALGPGVDNVRQGDRVAALSYRAFAEYDIADADALVPLPARLEGLPFPGEALGCAVNVFRRADVRPDHTVAIIGIGFLGALLTRLASHAGARVLAVSRRPFALDVARQLGAAATIRLTGPSGVADRVGELTAGAGADRVIECVGLQESLDLAAELTRVRGRLIIAGYHQDGPRQVNMQLWNWRGLDVINAHERDEATYLEGIRSAVQAIGDRVLDPRSLYTHVLPLERLGDALDLLRTRPDGFLKALVVP